MFNCEQISGCLADNTLTNSSISSFGCMNGDKVSLEIIRVFLTRTSGSVRLVQF